MDVYDLDDFGGEAADRIVAAIEKAGFAIVPARHRESLITSHDVAEQTKVVVP